MSDDKNRLFLIFVKPILNDMNRLNMDFKSECIDHG